MLTLSQFFFEFFSVVGMFLQLVRIFLLQKSFSPNKTKLKETVIQSSKKKKKGIFLAFVIGYKNSLFLF